MKLLELRIGGKKIEVEKVRSLNHPSAKFPFWDFEFLDGTLLLTSEPVHMVYQIDAPRSIRTPAENGDGDGSQIERLWGRE
jgi:hypothetical protein